MASRCQRCARASILWSSVDMSGLFLLFGALAKQKPAHDLKSWLVAPGTPCRQGGYVKRGVKKREAAPALLAVSVASILRLRLQISTSTLRAYLTPCLHHNRSAVICQEF